MIASKIAAKLVAALPPGKRWLFLAMALHAFYCIFDARQRDVVYGEFYKLRFMRRAGAPASVRTAILAFLLWGAGFVTFLHPRFWDWDYSGVLAIGLFGTLMLSSFVDARDYRKHG